ncbi:hypothetical protein BH09MYX1_BH09MYX1_58840 [soil metagenome]
MLNYKTPGVFIEEIATVGPIVGVGTSTPAFLGSANTGPINTPVKITNWTQFKDRFGGYIVSPRRYMAHAIRGFFDNGGTVCYVVRVGTGANASLDLVDRGTPGGTSIRLTALAGGTGGNAIKVTVTDANIVAAASVLKASATITSASGTLVTLATPADSSKFRAGDYVTLADNAAEHVQIARSRNGQLLLANPLVGTAYKSGDTVRIADLVPGQKQARLAAGAGIEAGSAIQFSAGTTTTTQDASVDATVPFSDGTVLVTLSRGLGSGYPMKASDADVTVSSQEFAVAISNGITNETFTNLAMDPRHSRYFVRAISSTLVSATLPQSPEKPSSQVPPGDRPVTIADATLTGGADDDLEATGPNQYDDALRALETVDDVTLVLCPDRTDASGVQSAVRDHCERMAERFAILDTELGLAPDVTAGSALGKQRAFLESARGYGALYYPWIEIRDPNSRTGEGTMMVPPSGHIAGVFARSDDLRGIHKSPANEMIAGVVGLSQVIDGVTQGELNEAGVNVIRIFSGQARPVVWGARTTCPAEETPWRYVNVRRLFLYVEESIQKGIRWAVFEPNDLALWKKLQRTIVEFLTRVWRSGALFGATAAEAFYVKIDEENNPPATRALGQVVIEIGIAPVRPAEFVVVRIGMWDGGSNVSEE